MALTAQIRHNWRSSISDARFWAGKFNDWAEMLNPSNDSAGGGGEGGGQPNYELLLAIMRIVQKEMDIRQQTRSLEETRNGNPGYTNQSRALVATDAGGQGHPRPHGCLPNPHASPSSPRPTAP
jgi:hypothetical protein